MRTRLTVTVVALFAAVAMAGVSFAAKTYQVTGPVLELTDNTIVVQKGTDKWELARDAATKVKGGELKVGDKVTIHYVMTAKDIEVKADKPEAKEAKPTKAAAKKN